MTTVLDLLFSLVGIAILVLGLVLLVESVAALVRRTPRPLFVPEPDRTPRFVVLVPAHDEAAGIEATVAALRADLGGLPAGRARVVVVADNCSDETAARAEAGGSEVIVRTDPENRGKGFALAYGLDHLASDPPEAVIVVDADCRIPTPGGLAALAARALDTDGPVQAEYVLEPQADAPPKTRVSAFAIVFKNRVRPRGMEALGLPCPLTGSGMAFPWTVLRKAPPTGAYLVEDMLIGLELARLGHPPSFLESVQVTSALPLGEEASKGQRRRWEHGHLETIRRLAWPTLRDGVRLRSLPLLAMGLDLVVPPLALTVLAMLGAWIVLGLWSLVGGSEVPRALVGSGLTATVAAVALAWGVFGRSVLPPNQILAVGRYVLGKIPLYLSFFRSGAHRTWERTDRDAAPSGRDAGPASPGASTNDPGGDGARTDGALITSAAEPLPAAEALPPAAEALPSAAEPLPAAEALPPAAEALPPASEALPPAAEAAEAPRDTAESRRASPETSD